MTSGSLLWKIINKFLKNIFSPGVFERDDEPVEEFIRQIETTETLENIEKEKFLDSIGECPSRQLKPGKTLP